MERVVGRRRFAVSERPVVVGIFNRTRNSIHDRGAPYALDRVLARADQHDARIGGQAADLAYRLRAERG
jgi:dihydropteroate synthase